MSSDPIINVAAYKFAPLEGLRELRAELLAEGRSLGLKGTILISREGINLFIAGDEEAAGRMLERLRLIPGLEDLRGKYSRSREQPFTRMLVRIKKEIIAFGVEGIDPARDAGRVPSLAPAELKRWLDEGRPVTLLDTRNDYEIKLGTFAGAMTLGIDHFRQFPEAVARLPERLKDQPIVMFCTGGIRCEKAGLHMQREGFARVHQLEGGILRYFEDCGGAHYEGECFVFDQRVGVDPALRETAAEVCHACQAPLTAEEQEDPRHVPGTSCPHCYRGDAERMEERLERRRGRLREVVEPLPGSVPYENRRPIDVPASADGLTLIEFLQRVFGHAEPGYWVGQVGLGRLIDCDGRVVAGDLRLRGGDRLLHRLPGTVEPEVNAAIDWLYEDEALVVLNKPAPLPMHACGRYHRNTLRHLLNRVHHPDKPRPAHRLDANTSGVVVFTRSRRFAAMLQPRFERGEVEKRYLARVIGRPAAEHWVCDEPIASGPGELGARWVDRDHGLEAETRFRLVAVLDDGTSLVEAQPVTGRTNQIRVHLWHQGLPVVGDPVYLPGGGFGRTQTLAPGDPPMCLHAWSMGFEHPLTNDWCRFEAPLPEWGRGRGGGSGSSLA